MENLKEQYSKVVDERKDVLRQIEELEKDENVKKYIELKGHNDKLIKQLYIDMKNDEYSSCNHILVNTLHDYDSCEGRSYNYYGCIKCGLDSRILSRILEPSESFLLPLEQKVMYDFLKKNGFNGGVDFDDFCDLDLGKAIYSKIKERHPDIDDETAMKYFGVALNDIRNIEVSEDRKENRAKRLSLSPKFNKWYRIDVERY